MIITFDDTSKRLQTGKQYLPKLATGCHTAVFSLVKHSQNNYHKTLSENRTSLAGHSKG